VSYAVLRHLGDQNPHLNSIFLIARTARVPGTQAIHPNPAVKYTLCKKTVFSTIYSGNLLYLLTFLKKMIM
jgi:hypothetical protein